MARGKANFEQHLKILITNLTGFEDSDDNFSLCWQFAQSNIKYHRFLDVDSHQLTRSVDGLITKLQVHSQNEKAESLRCLVDKFLDSPLSDKELTQSDLHYAIIQLLLNIGDSPTKTVYKAPPTKVAQDEEDDFDWTSHLLAGEDQGRQLYIESPELSSSEEDDAEGEKTDEDNPVQGKTVSFHRDVIDKVDDVNKGGNQHALVDIVSTDRISLLDRGSNWLEKNVVVQYWKGVSEHTAWTNQNESNLYADWECYLSRTNPLYSIPSDLKVTEWQLMRELLWMLSGVKELFICHYRNGRFFIREDLAMSHVTKESLSQTLELFFRHGAQVQRLHEFISDVTDNTCNNNNGPDQQVSQTYQAFAQWLSQFLRTLKTSLCVVEKRMVKQEETLSIYKLVKELQPWFTKLSLVYDVFYRGTNNGLLKGDNAQMSSHLLSVLYNAVLDNDGLDDTSTGMAPMMLTMWVETSRPYLDIIDEWITNGNLIDPRKEFLIQRWHCFGNPDLYKSGNEVVKSLDENFWETAFSFHCPDSQVTSPDEELSGSEGQKECMETKSIGQQKSIAWAPKFLQPVLREVVLAGKSMELLQNLGRLGEVIGGKGQKESLIEAFGKTAAPSVDEGDQGEVTQLTVFTQHIKQQMRVKGTHDHLLQANFAAIFDANVVRRNPLTTNTEALVKCLSHVDLGGLQPIGLLLEQSLYPYIHRRYRLVCLKLVEILTQEYRLLDYLKSMRHFFLMEAGDSLFDFYTQLFSKVQSHGVWRDYYSLNLVLQEALQTHHPEELTRLTLDITQHSYKAKDSNPINAFDGLRLHYKVPWPLDIVISSKTQEIYNQIFIFLLQIKYAKYSVDRLQFTALERENLFKTMVQPEDAFSRYGNEGEEFDLQDNQEELPRGQRVHRMQLLRMRLINFVNSLHTFIMTRILHSTGLEFMAEIQNATDLDQIIGIHGGYALKIQDRCLQHRGVAFLKEAVVKLLNLCVIFSARWQHGVDDISSQSIESLETEFGKCVKFLSSFLFNVVQRGTFPHLEPLAFALANSLEQKVS